MREAMSVKKKKPTGPMTAQELFAAYAHVDSYRGTDWKGLEPAEREAWGYVAMCVEARGAKP